MRCSTLGVADFIRVPPPAARTITAAGRSPVTIQSPSSQLSLSLDSGLRSPAWLRSRTSSFNGSRAAGLAHGGLRGVLRERSKDDFAAHPCVAQVCHSDLAVSRPRSRAGLRVEPGDCPWPTWV